MLIVASCATVPTDDTTTATVIAPKVIVIDESLENTSTSLDSTSYVKNTSTPVKTQKSKKTELADIIQTTIETNPEIAIAAAQEEDASIGIKIAKAAYHPTVDFTLSKGRESTFTKTTRSENIDREEANIQINHTFFNFGGTKNAVERRNALLKSAKLRKTDATGKIALEVTEAYIGFLKQTSLSDIAKKNIDSHKEIAKFVMLSEEGGNSTIADVKRVETRLDSAKSAKLNSDDALKDTITAFKRLTGVSPYEIKRPKKLVPRIKKNIKEQWRTVAAKNPKLLSLEADRLSLEKQLKQQQSTLLPEVFGLVEANYKDNVGGESGLNRDVRGMVGVRVRLYDGGARLGAAEQIQARISEADARHIKLHRELTENLENNNNELSSSKEKTEFLASSLQAARKVITLYTQQFKAGERTPFEMIDAQRDLFRAGQDSINHRYDTIIATYRDLRLRGILVKNLKKL